MITLKSNNIIDFVFILVHFTSSNACPYNSFKRRKYASSISLYPSWWLWASQNKMHAKLFGRCVYLHISQSFDIIIYFFFDYIIKFISSMLLIVYAYQYFIIIDENEYSMSMPVIFVKMWSMHTNVDVMKWACKHWWKGYTWKSYTISCTVNSTGLSFFFLRPDICCICIKCW